MGTTKAGSWFLSIPTYERSTLSAFSGLIVLKMLIVHKNTTQRKEKDEVFIMLTREQKETMLNQILELMTAIAYDEPVEKGKSMWISPNYDDRMEQEIISYVVPLYSNGGLIAVAGIDILFSELTDLIDDLCLGYKLPGAGGGGYLYMIAKDPEAAVRIKQILGEHRLNKNARFVDMTLSTSGLQISRS